MIEPAVNFPDVYVMRNRQLQAIINVRVRSNVNRASI